MFTCYHCMRFMLPMDTVPMPIELQRDANSRSLTVVVNVCSECFHLPESERQHGGRESLLVMHDM